MPKEPIIDSLGGYTEVAKALGLETKVVWNWQSRGIPWRYRPRVAQLAADLGKKTAIPANFLEPDAA